jgi:hypothetical protein
MTHLTGFDGIEATLMMRHVAFRFFFGLRGLGLGRLVIAGLLFLAGQSGKPQAKA